MAFIIDSGDVKVGHQFSLKDNKAFLLNGKSAGSIPTLYSSDCEYVEIVNSWFLYLAIESKKEDLNSYKRALLAYWNYLESTDLKWNKFPGIKSEKPTYTFRTEVLIKRIKQGTLARSTANGYMRHVIQFYYWAIHHRHLIIKDELCAPFKIELVKISRDDAFAHMKPNFHVETTDLRIRVDKDSMTNKVRGLKPIQIPHVELIQSNLNSECIEFQLILLLVLICGLRIEEACSFTGRALENAIKSEDEYNYDISIGPAVGVNTKYDKERTIEMSSDLYELLSKYLLSNKRLNRLDKLQEKLLFVKNLPSDSELGIPLQKLLNLERAENFDTIFISQRGNPFTASTVNTRWSLFRRKLKKIDPSFNHKFYDARSTYGTYRLKDLLDKGISPSDALELIMGWMGHNHESTVWNYLKFLQRKELFKDKFGMLDQIMDDAIKSCSEDE